MGFKFSDTNIICPLFKRVTKTSRGNLILISCEIERFNLGFEADVGLRFKTSKELKDFTELFCKECYQECPLFKNFAKEG